MSRKCEQRLKG